MTMQAIISEMMKKFAVTGVIAFAAATLAMPLAAQKIETPAKTTAVPQGSPKRQEENEAPAAQKPGMEGIKVHGHWIIDVKDKAGNIVEHRDFQNSLQDTNLLTLLLTGQAVMNSLSVGIGTTGTDSFYLYPAGSVVSPISTGCNSGTPTCNPNLVMTTLGTVSGNGPHLTGIKLAGQFTPTTSETVTNVNTNFATCSVSPVPTPGLQFYVNSPSQCAAQSYTSVQGAILQGVFTGTSLSPTLAVAAGQTVSVSVTLSFS